VEEVAGRSHLVRIPHKVDEPVVRRACQPRHPHVDVLRIDFDQKVAQRAAGRGRLHRRLAEGILVGPPAGRCAEGVGEHLAHGRAALVVRHEDPLAAAAPRPLGHRHRLLGEQLAQLAQRLVLAQADASALVLKPALLPLQRRLGAGARGEDGVAAEAVLLLDALLVVAEPSQHERLHKGAHRARVVAAAGEAREAASLQRLDDRHRGALRPRHVPSCCQPCGSERARDGRAPVPGAELVGGAAVEPPARSSRAVDADNHHGRLVLRQPREHRVDAVGERLVALLKRDHRRAFGQGLQLAEGGQVDPERRRAVGLLANLASALRRRAAAPVSRL